MRNRKSDCPESLQASHYVLRLKFYGSHARLNRQADCAQSLRVTHYELRITGYA